MNRRRGIGHRRQQPLEQRRHVVEPDRLVFEDGAERFDLARFFIFHERAGDDPDGQVLAGRICAQPTKEFQAGESRHPHVDQQRIRARSSQEIESLAGIFDCRRLVTGHSKHSQIRSRHSLIVVDDQNARHEGDYGTAGMPESHLDNRELPLREVDKC